MKYKSLISKSNKKSMSSYSTYNKYCKSKEDHILKSLENYLAEKYLFKDALNTFAPFKIVEYQKISNSIRITDYSTEFLRQYYFSKDTDTELENLSRSIFKLKNKAPNLFDSLNYLWGKPIKSFECHKSTVYRRITKALRFIATDLKLLKAD